MIKKYLCYIGEEAKKKRLGVILDFVEKNPQAALLDCGCDNGEFTKEVAKKIKAKEITGIEINEIRVGEARKRGVLVYDVDLNQRFPFEENSIDVVISIQVIEHLYDLDNFVSEIYRVLKPGGYSIISTENLASLHNIFALLLGNQPYTGPHLSKKFAIGHHPLNPSLQKLYEEKPYMKSTPFHTKVMTYRALKQLLESYHFKVTFSRGVGYYPLWGKLADFLAWLDRWHATFVVVKARKAKLQ